MKGWIYLHRDVMNHWTWRNPRHFQWWVLLLLIAEWSPTKLQLGNSVISIKRGEIVTTIRMLAKQMNTTAKTVLSFLSILEQNEMIILTKKQRFTHIKIVNYERFQNASNEALREQKVKRKLQQIKENNKIINNNISHTARTREKEIAEEVLKSEYFIENCAKALECDIEQVKSLFEAFTNEMDITDKTHSDVSDFKQHFLNWAKIKQNGRNTQQQNKSGADKYEARRGNGVGAKKADDFSGSF